MQQRFSLSLFAISFLSMSAALPSWAQTNQENITGTTNPITTAVPFLGIVPDARTSGVGDAQGPLSGDANSILFNNSKLAFTEKPIAASLSITPWLRNFGVNDMYLSLLSGYYKVTKQDAISFGFTYFNLGSLQFTDNSGAAIRDFNPQEIAVTGGYARQLTSNFAVGVSGKYIYSNLSGNISNSAGVQGRPGQSIAVDVSGYYKKPLVLGAKEAELIFSGSVNNFGPKISYSNNDSRDFIPTMVRLGGGLNLNLDPYNKIIFLVDASKLAVPTVNDSASRAKNLLDGVFSSFSDAPGGGKEELQEIMIGGGMEYWYDNLFALRLGYFNENKDKGNRKFLTVGAGIKYQKLGIDLSYLLPSVQGAQSPLANTIRFTISVDFDKPEQDTKSVTE